MTDVGEDDAVDPAAVHEQLVGAALLGTGCGGGAQDQGVFVPGQGGLDAGDERRNERVSSQQGGVPGDYEPQCVGLGRRPSVSSWAACTRRRLNRQRRFPRSPRFEAPAGRPGPG